MGLISPPKIKKKKHFQSSLLKLLIHSKLWLLPKSNNFICYKEEIWEQRRTERAGSRPRKAAVPEWPCGLDRSSPTVSEESEHQGCCLEQIGFASPRQREARLHSLVQQRCDRIEQKHQSVFRYSWYFCARMDSIRSVVVSFISVPTKLL